MNQLGAQPEPGAAKINWDFGGAGGEVVTAVAVLDFANDFLCLDVPACLALGEYLFILAELDSLGVEPMRLGECPVERSEDHTMVRIWLAEYQVGEPVVYIDPELELSGLGRHR